MENQISLLETSEEIKFNKKKQKQITQAFIYRN